MKNLLIIAVLFIGSAFSQDSSKVKDWFEKSDIPRKYTLRDYNFEYVAHSTKENGSVFYASQNLRVFPASMYSNTKEIEFVTIPAPFVDKDGKPNSFETITSIRLFVNCSSKKWGYDDRTVEEILAYPSIDGTSNKRFPFFYCYKTK